MGSFSIRGVSGIRGVVRFPGDKSIAHRCIIAASLSRRSVIIKNFPVNDDCLATINAFRKLGIKIKQVRSTLVISGRGLKGLKKPSRPILINESGTTFRLMLGVLAGQDFSVTLAAGKSLIRRPMLRVTSPLRLMGAAINSRPATHDPRQEEYPPITIKGGNLEGMTYKMPVASAQVKSAILLAGLFAKGKTRVIECIKTRDHTERILKLFKSGIKIKKNVITVEGGRELSPPSSVYVPGDISSAAFFMVAGLICPNSKVVIEAVSLNPTRTGVLKVLKRMGADIQIKKSKLRNQDYEPTGDVIVKTSKLRGAKVSSKEIPYLIDELPILMVAACFAKGQTVFEGVGELRVKETDRIRSMSDNLAKMGGDIKLTKSGGLESVIVSGAKELRGSSVKSFGDHRTAMSMVVAGLVARGITRIDNVACISKSFPRFLTVLNKLK